MSVVCVIGTQWGDEGKGKIADLLAERADYVIRFQGGDNAGHSVVNDVGDFGLHLVPEGIFRENAINVLGPGTVVNPDALLKEIDDLRGRIPGVDFEARFRIAERAHVVMPYHVALDGALETSRGAMVQGSTKRGIAPVYSDKAARSGVRIGDLLASDYLREYLPHIVEAKNRLLESVYGIEPIDLDVLIEKCREWGEALRPYVVDTFPMVQGALAADKNILLIGQLGIMRDLDWGHYPYVTSSTPTAAGACVSLGIPPNQIGTVVGVVKAFTSSVGEGPFPTEQDNEIGNTLRTKGDEFGVSTGRPRRCGWLDLVAVNHAVAINGPASIALTKIDMLDGFDPVVFAKAYRLNGNTIDAVPDTRVLETVEPVYDSVAGWDEETGGVRTWDDLPANARRYVERVEEVVGVPVSLVGTGRHRDHVIVRDLPEGW